MPQVEPSHLVEKDVEVEVFGQSLIELDALVKEGNALGGEVVGANDRRGAGAGAAAQITFVENGHVLNAQLGEVVGGGQPMHTAANDDHAVAVAQRPPFPHPAFPKNLKHTNSPELY